MGPFFCVTASVLPHDWLPSWLLLIQSSSWQLFIYLLWTFCMAHLGYLHLAKASLRCCNSSLKSSGPVQTILALWVRVPMTLYLAERFLMVILLQVLFSMSGHAVHRDG